MSPDIEIDLPRIETKKDVIDRILQRDKEAFDAWVNDPKNQRRLDITPTGALRHLFITRRLLEAARDPSQVDLVAFNDDDNELEVLTVEHLDTILSNKELVTKFAAEYEQDTPTEDLPQAEEVDKLHLVFRSWVEAGIIDAKDYIFHYHRLAKRNEDQLWVDNYIDRDELRGTGITKDFYTQLHEEAARMGFRFIVGANNSSNVGFFTKLGRVTLAQVKPELIEKLFVHAFTPLPDELKPTYTVDFLQEDDKELYSLEHNQ